MEKLEINFSEKNIPLCNLWTYKRSLLTEIERFKENLRWKIFFFKRPELVNKKDYFGLKTPRSAPHDPELDEFERRLYNMVTQIKFRKVRMSKLNREMKSILKMIHQKKMITVKSDKTSNFFLVKPEDYYKLMNRELNKQYKKDDYNRVEHKINKNAKLVSETLGIDDRIETLRKEESYLLLKDHKPSFYRERQARLINPIKNQLGIVSKAILDRINSKARKILHLNQLRSTQEAIDWFVKLRKKIKKC